MARLTIVSGAIGTGKSMVARALHASLRDKGATLIEGGPDCAMILHRELERAAKYDQIIVVDNHGVLHAAMFTFNDHVVYQVHCSH